jgi:undecaprenyl-diphosphatase
MLATVWLTCLLSHGGALDRELFSQIHGHGEKLLPTAERVSTLGSPLHLLVVLALAAALLLWFGRMRATVLLIVLVLSCRVIRLMQEAAFALPRPNFVAHVGAVSPYGFPSGHATNSMATYLSIALILGARSPWRLPAVAFALALTFAVGVSRIILGVHWPSDVLAGWSFGCFWTLGTVWLTTALKKDSRAKSLKRAVGREEQPG